MEKEYSNLLSREKELWLKMQELILSVLKGNNGIIVFEPENEDEEYPVSATLWGKHDNPIVDITEVYLVKDDTILAGGINQSTGIRETGFEVYPEHYSDILHFIAAVLNWKAKAEPLSITILLGPELINEYKETGEFPSEEWLENNGGVIDTISYDTEEEMSAFLEGVNLTDGWTDALVLDDFMINLLAEKRELGY